jgi:hypothetical protein
MRRGSGRDSAAAALLLVAACSGAIGKGEKKPSGEACRGLPPLELAVAPGRVRTGMGAVLAARGGSGHYVFGVEAGGSGGEVRGDRFVAGMTPGVDKVYVEDAVCGGGRATAGLEVIGPFKVSPTRGVIRPGTAFTIVAEGTVGAPVFVLAQSASGGSLGRDGKYAAGPREGLDLVHARDGETGDEVLVQLRVSSAARFRADPERLAVPAGAPAPLATADGTDAVDWKKLAGPGAVVPREGLPAVFVAEANASGTTELEARDRFTGEVARLKVRVLDELKRPTTAHGRSTDTAAMVTGDFDGDRVPDLAVGIPESDVGRPQGGVVLVWRGSAEGLGPKPTWTIAGSTDTAQLGAALAAGDLDGDGRDDLAVAAPGADVTVGDSGGVELYRFRGDGPELMRPPLTGVGRGSFGASLAVADVDGDGMKDVIVGAPGADVAPTASLSRRGVVDIFAVKKAVPIPDLGTLRLSGWDLAADGTVAPRSAVGLGRALVVADLDGDDRPDVAALGALQALALPPATAGAMPRPQPAVQIHFSRGGARPYEELPDAFVLPADPADTNEGTYRLAALPRRGGRPPLLAVLADLADAPGASNAGAVLLFDVSKRKPPGPATRRPAVVERTDAFARIAGDAAGVAAGRSFALFDVDDDKEPELLLGAPLALAPGAAAGTPPAGKILVFGLGGLAAGAEVAPRGQRFGRPGDALGAGLAPWALPRGAALVAFASRASTDQGRFTGRLDALAAEKAPMEAWKPVSASVPAAAAGEAYGTAVAAAVAGGRALAAVGAPQVPGVRGALDGTEPGLGRAAVFDLAAPGAPKLAVDGALAPLHRGGRGVGTDVAFTDFNGDGRPDLVVGAPGLQVPGQAQRATEIEPHYAREAPGCLAASTQSTGGVLVHLGLADGGFAPAYRLWAPIAIAGCAPATDARCRRSGLGRAVAGGFDWNGDGRQDVAALRSGGFDVFLGRPPDDPGLDKLTMVCDPAFTLPSQAPASVSALAPLGDLDGDPCHELGLRVSTDGSRGGVLVLFGHDGEGKCRGGAAAGAGAGAGAPVGLRILADGDVGLSAVGLGLALARLGRFTADGRDVVAVSATRYPVEGAAQPAILLYEAAALAAAARAPAATPPPAPATQDAGAAGSPDPVLRIVTEPAWGGALAPRVLVTRDRPGAFGQSLAGGVDVTGDGRPDLIVGAPGASVASEGSGAVFVYAGGVAAGTDRPHALAAALTILGDARERGQLGADIAVTGATDGAGAVLVVGAPASYRTGTRNGTAFALPLRF